MLKKSSVNVTASDPLFQLKKRVCLKPAGPECLQVLWPNLDIYKIKIKNVSHIFAPISLIIIYVLYYILYTRPYK